LSFYILSRGKFADDLMIEIGEMLEKKMVLENEILEFENLKQKNEELNQSFDLKSKEIEDKNTALVEKLDRIETTYEELNTKLETAKTESQEITDILTESKSNKGIIDSFVERVSSRQTQLDDQEEKTKAYENKLLEFETEIKTRIDEAKDLIKESEDVLKLNSARGISDHFASQYNVASRWWVFALWLISSLLFLGVAVSIGWLLLSAQSQDLPTVVARISLLPILLTGAYFTANQYVKQKNIAEDYAYKQVLSKSLVGFSREILKQGNNGNPEYQKFMAKVFEQMLQDPLRSRKEKSFEMEHKSENIVDLLTKLISEVNKNK
jgi:DNA repair exonuclease SbcCD ATPase subunit